MSVPHSATPRLRVQILGPLRVWRDGREVDAGPRQQRSVLAFLAARAGSPITVTEMIDLLWGEDPPTSAENAVHRYVGALRRVLDPTIEARSRSRRRAGFRRPLSTPSYNSSGQLVTAAHSSGRQLALSFDQAGRLVSVAASDGRAVAYAYTSGGRLESVTQPGGAVTLRGRAGCMQLSGSETPARARPQPNGPAFTAFAGQTAGWPVGR